jgi:hypothetical protein
MSDELLLFSKPAGDGRTVYVYPLTFGRGRIMIGTDDFLEDAW